MEGSSTVDPQDKMEEFELRFPCIDGKSLLIYKAYGTPWCVVKGGSFKRKAEVF